MNEPIKATYYVSEIATSHSYVTSIETGKTYRELDNYVVMLRPDSWHGPIDGNLTLTIVDRELAQQFELNSEYTITITRK